MLSVYFATDLQIGSFDLFFQFLEVFLPVVQGFNVGCQVEKPLAIAVVLGYRRDGSSDFQRQ